MAQIASIDWNAKRFYLHADTTLVGFDAWEAFAEVRTLVEANANGEQNYPLFIHRQGKVAKGGGKFTPRYTVFNSGWRGVPHDSDHQLQILVEMVSDDQVSDRDVFDRSGLVSQVDIDTAYQQVEVIEVNTGGASGLTPLQDANLSMVASQIGEIEAGLSHQEVMRLLVAVLTGKLSGVEGGTITIRDLLDTKDRLTVVTDAHGNRLSVTRDAT